jgi:hypothetical protein
MCKTTDCTGLTERSAWIPKWDRSKNGATPVASLASLGANRPEVLCVSVKACGDSIGPIQCAFCS